MKKYLLLLPLILACGIAPIGQITQSNPNPAAAPLPPRELVTMVVTADEAVYIRAGAGTMYDVSGELVNGGLVTVDKVATVGDSLWCHHADGWTNCRYLQAVDIRRIR